MIPWVNSALAIIKAIPIVDKWFALLAAAYHREEFEKMRKENAESIRKAIRENDQRWIEKTLRSSTAGKPSGVPSTEVRDTLPGVE